MLFAGVSFVFATIVASVASAADTGVNTNLVQQLKVATTNMDRMNLLPKSSDWFFDFTKSDKSTFSAGGVVYADAATFPATTGNGMSMSIINLGPCSMLPPHVHPRATKYAVAVKGTTHTWMITENGAPLIEETLTTGQMTIFPQAAVHSMMNVGCEDAQLVCSFNSEDPGTNNLANAFFDMPTNITQTVLGASVDIQAVAGQLPGVGTGSIAGPEQCLKACAAKGKFIKSY